MDSKAVILASARTPFGRLGGALASLPATVLGGEAIRSALLRSGLDPAEVEHVIMGMVLQGGAGQAPARQAAYNAGLAKTVTFETINKVCASGMIAIVHGARLISDGDADVVAAGGMESMSNAPYAALAARFGYRFGDGALVDLMNYDGLLDPWSKWTMASGQAKVNAHLGITREVQDEFAYHSHVRAAQATADGSYAAEIVPLKIATKAKGKLVVDQAPVQARSRVPAHAGANGSSKIWSHESHEALVPDHKRFSPYVTGDVPHSVVEKDEPIRPDTSIESLGKLPPLDKDGTVTAGNAPGVNDGAAAVILASEDYARNHGRDVVAHVGSRVSRADAGDGDRQAARQARPARLRHPRVGSERGVRRRRVEHGKRTRPRPARPQSPRGRRRARASDRRVGRPHHRERGAPTAQARRRSRHRRHLQRRRPGRRDPDQSRLERRRSWLTTYACS
jgi:acetyl-CoA acetyltransferase